MPLLDERVVEAERRGNDRFPIESELRYRLLDARAPESGLGRTLNMSSSGVLFTSESALPIGRKVELSVDWPAELNENCGLKLVAQGKIVRSSTECAAITIDKYDFRTRATARVRTAGSGSSGV